MSGNNSGKSDDQETDFSIEQELNHNWTRVWNESLPSDPVDGVQFIKVLLEALEQLSWPEKELFGIHMSLEEAIMNAIKHGNCHCGDKCVTIDARASTEKFYIRVKDEGEGFDPDDVPDPTLDENLTKPSGRGVMLMKIYMSVVRYNESGNQVELLKIRDQGN